MYTFIKLLALDIVGCSYCALQLTETESKEVSTPIKSKIEYSLLCLFIPCSSRNKLHGLMPFFRLVCPKARLANTSDAPAPQTFAGTQVSRNSNNSMTVTKHNSLIYHVHIGILLKTFRHIYSLKELKLKPSFAI